MKPIPEIEWLERRWGLEGAAAGEVEALLEVERGDGSTAHPLTSAHATWGKAAANPAVIADSPLVIVSDLGVDYLQTRRLYLAETTIASKIARLAGGSFQPPKEKLLTALFSGTQIEALQRNAVRTAVSRQLTLITGGPGTGKTFTLARILAVLSLNKSPSDSIRLAAPTGKAAERMKRAVTDSPGTLPQEFQGNVKALGRIAQASSTIHSLLGYNPSEGVCRFNAGNPLRCSVLIVDECSMVDVLLWKALLDALPPEARLILIGDPDQLQSVGQGNVFAELTRFASEESSPLHSSLIHLTSARRFQDRPAILALAEAIRDRDPENAAILLSKSAGNKSVKGLAWMNLSGGILPINDLPLVVLESIQAVASAPTPGAALDALSRVCILSAHREYFAGSKAINAQVDLFLSRHGPVRNRPIIVNRNDQETGLRNGSIGVISADAAEKRKAYFPWGDGSIREFPVAKLPEYDSAWAITIHRSQGSEYDDVLVVLPHEESPMATRELLYTAITRARQNVYIAGSLETVRAAVKTSSRRITLLNAALRRAFGKTAA
jgi:exodeoxyribonuclease V alpha subunit